jgi:hypothetical protein
VKDDAGQARSRMSIFATRAGLLCIFTSRIFEICGFYPSSDCKLERSRISPSSRSGMRPVPTERNTPQCVTAHK